MVMRTPATAAISSRKPGTIAIVPPTFAPKPGHPEATTVNTATAAAAATARPRPAVGTPPAVAADCGITAGPAGPRMAAPTSGPVLAGGLPPADRLPPGAELPPGDMPPP